MLRRPCRGAARVVTSVEYRAMLRLPVAGAGHPSPVPLAVTLVARERYRVTCGVCGTSTGSMDWAGVNRAALAHRGVHARHNAGEPLTITPRVPAPALEAGAAA